MTRIGMLTPSSNTVLEPATATLAATLPDLSVHFSRFPVTAIADSPDSHGQFQLQPMLEAARLLADARVDLICWNGTSGAWEGLDRDRDLVRAIETQIGIPATTGTLSLLDAFDALGVRSYGLVCPYLDVILARMLATFAAAGYACAGSTNESVSVNFDFAALEPALIARRVRTLVATQPDAIAIFCTNLRGAGLAQPLAAELGIPILDSVVVSLWGALHRLGVEWAAPGFGTGAKAGR